MKRRQFLRELAQQGCVVLRAGSNHDIYTNPATGRHAAVPRHTELNQYTCRSIRRQLGLIVKAGDDTA